MSFLTQTYKSAAVEKVTGMKAVTLRSWRLKGLLSDMGIEPDGTTNRYTFVQLCVLGVAAKLIQDEREMPGALRVALEMLPFIETIVRQPDPQTVAVVGVERSNNWAECSHWTGWAVLNRRAKGIYTVEPVLDLQDWAKWSPLFMSSQVVSLVNVADICRTTVERLEMLTRDNRA